MKKLKEVNMNELKEEMKKVKVETEKNRENLRKELEKMKLELQEKNAAMIDYGFDRTGFLMI